VERLKSEAERDFAIFAPWKNFYIHVPDLAINVQPHTYVLNQVLWGAFLWDPETASSALLEYLLSAYILV